MTFPTEWKVIIKPCSSHHHPVMNRSWEWSHFPKGIEKTASRHCREGLHPFLREVRQVIEEATDGHMSQGAFFA
jgi:hypothetical protein